MSKLTGPARLKEWWQCHHLPQKCQRLTTLSNVVGLEGGICVVPVPLEAPGGDATAIKKSAEERAHGCDPPLEGGGTATTATRLTKAPPE